MLTNQMAIYAYLQTQNNMIIQYCRTIAFIITGVKKKLTGNNVAGKTY